MIYKMAKILLLHKMKKYFQKTELLKNETTRNLVEDILSRTN